MLNEQALIAGANAELKRVAGRPVALEVPIQTLMILVGLLQVACRHPKIADGPRRAAEQFVNGVGANLQEQGLHGLAALVKAGWVDES